MNAQSRRAKSGKTKFLAMLEKEVMLWSDIRLDEARQRIFIKWCFDTGDPVDLKKFDNLDREANMRKTWSPPRPPVSE